MKIYRETQKCISINKWKEKRVIAINIIQKLENGKGNKIPVETFDQKKYRLGMSHSSNIYQKPK